MAPSNRGPSSHFVLILLLTWLLPTLLDAQDSWFRRGDASGDGRVDVDDSLRIVDFLFGSQAPLDCLDAADVTDDGLLEIGDALTLLFFVTQSSPMPPAPGPFVCGPDPTPGSLGCISYSCPFIRGDADGNGVLGLGDMIAINNYLVAGGPLACLDAADANDDGMITPEDTTMLFSGGIPLPGPLISGPDYTEDTLDCQMYTPPVVYLRGDADGDADVDSDDVQSILDFVLLGGSIPCEAAADADGDGFVTTMDSSYVLNFIAAGGPPPPAPFPLCGIDQASGLPCDAEPCAFIRGDADGDGQVDEDDSLAIIDFLGAGGSLPCLDAADSNDDGVVDLQDSTVILQFVSGPATTIPPPGPHVCGIDPTADALHCGSYLCQIPNDFRRGDCNSDSQVNIADGILLLELVHPSAPGAFPPTCRDACDANDDGVLDVADPMRILCTVFACGPPPPPPYPDCGYDPTPLDRVGCVDYSQVGCP